MRTRDRLLGVIAAICALAIALVAPGAAAGLRQPGDDPAGRPAADLRPQRAGRPDAADAARDGRRPGAGVGGVEPGGAPAPTPATSPKFNATNPAAYPPGAWFRYDFLDRVANQVGIKVYFQPTAPAPNWATTPRKLPQGYRWSHDPNAKDYGQFVQAVATRYSGSYVAPNFSGGGSSPLPRVSYWGMWNEPNIGGWMTPQWNTIKGGKKVEASPAIDRPLVDAAWSALVADRPPPRHDPDRRDGRLRRRPQGLRRQHGSAHLRPRLLLRGHQLQAAARARRPPTSAAPSPAAARRSCARTPPCSTPPAGLTIPTTSSTRRAFTAGTPTRPRCPASLASRTRSAGRGGPTTRRRGCRCT